MTMLMRLIRWDRPALDQIAEDPARGECFSSHFQQLLCFQMYMALTYSQNSICQIISWPAPSDLSPGESLLFLWLEQAYWQLGRWVTPINSSSFKSMSFALITKCSIHELCINRSSFNLWSPIYYITNIHSAAVKKSPKMLLIHNF